MGGLGPEQMYCRNRAKVEGSSEGREMMSSVVERREAKMGLRVVRWVLETVKRWRAGLMSVEMKRGWEEGGLTGSDMEKDFVRGESGRLLGR